MNSWIFYFTDSLGHMTAVVGSGESISEAEDDAKTKWDTAVSGRDDYAERSPIVEIVYSMISTEEGGDEMPGLLL
jgi:hypothetical protein